MADGAAFCSQCGQSFSVAAAAPRAPMMAATAAAPMGGGVVAVSGYPEVAAMPRVEYAGFWLRFLALIIDNMVMGISFVLILIPLIFLTGLGSLLSQIHPDQELDDAGIFFIMGAIFRSLDRKALRQNHHQHDPGFHRIHHGWVHGEEAGTTRHDGRLPGPAPWLAAMVYIFTSQ
jgi:hypothetical protein